MFNIKTFHSRYLGTSYSNLYLGTLILTMTYLKLNSRGREFKMFKHTLLYFMRGFVHSFAKTMNNLTVFNNYI